jgi:hypothetical protein
MQTPAAHSAMKSALIGGRAGAGMSGRFHDTARVMQRLCVASAALSVVESAVIGSAIVVVAGVLLAGTLNIWIDEAFTLHTTGAGPQFAWAQSIAFEAQPPLYFVLEALWRTFDETSIGFASLPSIVFAGAAVAFIVCAAARIMPRTPPLAIALVTALNPIVIWAAVEMRVYALVLLAGAALTWAFIEGFIVERPSRHARLWYAIFAVAGLYTQYYVGFVLAAQCITLLAMRRGMLRAFAGPIAFAAIAFAPFAGIAVLHVGASGAMVEHVSLAQAVHQITNTVFVYVLPHEITWSGAAKVAGFGVATLLVAALAIAGRPAVGPGTACVLIVAWLVSLAVFALAFAVCGAPLDIVRHLIVIAPMSLLVSYVLIASMTRRRGLAAGLAALVFAGFTVTQLCTAYHPPIAKRGEWQRVALTLEENDPSVPVAVFPAEFALPLNVYSPRATIPVPRPMPFTLDYVAATTLNSEMDVAHVLDPVRLRADRLWLVTQDACRNPKPHAFDYHCAFLEAYVDRHYRLTRDIEFRGAVARLYVKK